MNKYLYEDLINELRLSKNPEDVRNKLIQKLGSASDGDRFTTLLAFYDYMNDNIDLYSFIKTDNNWINFYKEGFNSYLTMDKINDVVNNILDYDSLFYIVMNICSDDIKKITYEKLKQSEDLSRNKNYAKVLGELEKYLVDKGIISNPKVEQPISEDLFDTIDKALQPSSNGLDSSNYIYYSDEEKGISNDLMSGSNVIQTIPITVYNTLMKRLSAANNLLNTDEYNYKQGTITSYDKIATIGSEDFPYILKSIGSKMALNKIAKPWEINKIISMINTNYKQDNVITYANL